MPHTAAQNWDAMRRTKKYRTLGGSSANYPGDQSRIADMQRRGKHSPGWRRVSSDLLLWSSNRRRMEATHVQLHRMGYRPAPTRLDCFEALTDNGKAIYRELETRYGFAHG